MKAKQLIDALRSQIAQELQAKTGWGRNEVLQAFERAATATLGELVEITSSTAENRSVSTMQLHETAAPCHICQNMGRGTQYHKPMRSCLDG